MYKTALITGATGGIGEELCREFARHGYDLVITARNPKKLALMAKRLQKTYQIQVTPIAADLAADETHSKLYEAAKNAGLEIDVLVNNAGFGLGGYFHRNHPGTQEEMVRLNILAPTKLCRLFLPDMIARGSGRVLNVASTGSFVPGPNNSVYCASKAYVLSLSEALSEEVQGSGVTVTALCPGATRTHFAHRADMESTNLFRYGVMDPRTVAKTGYRALMEGRRIVVVGMLNNVMIASLRVAPRILAAKVSGFLQKQKDED